MEMQAATGQPDRARIVMWELTRACRLSCLHCPLGAQQRRSPVELSTYEAYKTIDQIVALRPEELIITGGDPLERTDLYQLIDYSRRRGLQPTLMATATAALNGAAVGKLKRNGLSRLIVSLDSSAPDRHDAARGITGHFTATLMAIRWARTSELPLEVNTLMTRRNVGDLEAISALLTDVGAQRWNIYFLVPIGDAKHVEMLSGDEVEAVFATIHAISGRVHFPVRTFEAPQYRRFLLQHTLDARRRSIERLFDGGAEDEKLELLASSHATTDRTEIVFISHTGEVSSSAFLPLTAGNVRYQPLAALYRSAEMFQGLRDETKLKGKCGRCEFRRTCGGSRARAYAMTGDLFAADPLCNYQPGAWDAATPLLVRGDAGVLP